MARKDKKEKKSKKEKKQKKVQETQEQNVELEAKPRNERVLEPYVRTVKDLFAPFDITIPEDNNANSIIVNNKYIRSYVMQGYPSMVSIGWLDAIYNYNGNIDTAIYVEPADDRKAQDELTKKITQYQAQLAIEEDKGRVTHTTELMNKIQELYAEREKLEQNRESIYHISISSNLICDSQKDLDKESQILDNTLAGKRIAFMPMYLRMEQGFKNALPLANIYSKDKLRNFNTGALGACFPFYNSELSHEDGVWLGTNISTQTPMFINFYDKSKLANTNISVFGKAGSGKSYFVSLLTMRSALKGIRTVIVDPEDEYKGITRALNGVYIDISTESEHRMNPFDIEEEDELDDADRATGRKVVRVKEKISDVLNLIVVMAGEIDGEKISLISQLLQRVYKKYGITSDPNSLYYAQEEYDKETDTFYPAGKKKKMPCFSDLMEEMRVFTASPDGDVLKSTYNSLKRFQKGGIYDMFDCQSTINTEAMGTSLLVTFNVKQLEENVLRPIGMYVALTWAWEKFGKKNRSVKKRIICDEAWMLVNINMVGHEFTAKFLETCARRIRKRNGGLLVASQNFIEFANSTEGMAVLTNTAVHIFLQQSTTDIDALQEKFKLSDGERNFLLTASTGQILLRTENDSCIANVTGTPFEESAIRGDF